MPPILKRFADDRSGNFAMIFALASIPIALSAGLAIEYTNAKNAEGKLANALDAAALAAAATPGLTDEERLDLAARNFEANITLAGLKAEATFKTDGTSIQGKIDYEHPSHFGGLIGRKSFPIAIENMVSTVWGSMPRSSWYWIIPAR